MAHTYKGHITGDREPAQNARDMQQVVVSCVMNGSGAVKDRTLVFFSALQTIMTSRALEWLHQTYEQGITFSCLTDFLEKYEAQFCREVRYKKVEARMAFAERKVRQRSDVQAYVTHFRRITLKASDMSETDQIFWFLDGLKPELQERCATDSVGKPWTSLDAVIEYAYGQELALKSRSAVRAAHTQVNRAVHGSGPKPSSTRPTSSRPSSFKPPGSKASGSQPAASVANISGGKRTGAALPRAASRIKGPDHETSHKFKWMSIKMLRERDEAKACYRCGKKPFPHPEGFACKISGDRMATYENEDDA
jgi:hypothetical protein